MASLTRRLLARSLHDMTAVTAEQLRGRGFEPRLVEPPQADGVRKPATCQVICVASGKGGTGKTIVSTNLAVALAREGLRVTLLDADLGLANAHLLMGVTPEYDISTVISGAKKLNEVMVECPSGVKLIAGGSGFSELAELKDWQVRNLAEQLKSCEEMSDVILVDLSAGISPQVMRFLNNAHDMILVTTPDVTALMDAYATVKSMSAERRLCEIKVIINRAKGEQEALAAFEKIRGVSSRHLSDVRLSLFDWLPHNWYVQNSVHMREPVVSLHPKSFVTRSFQSMAVKIKDGHSRWMHAAGGSALPEDMGFSHVEAFSARLGRLTFA